MTTRFGPVQTPYSAKCCQSQSDNTKLPTSAEFSVIVPTHSRPALLRRAVASVFAQTCSNWELLIVNDGPEVDASAIHEASTPAKVQWLTTSGNLGASAARNLGAQQASGRFLSFLDDDDEWTPDYLQKMSAHLSATASSLAWCDIETVERDHKGRLQQHVKRATGRASHGPIDFISEVGAGWGLCILREVFTSSGGFDTTLKTSEDRDLLLRLVSEGHRHAGLALPLVRVHAHAGHRLSQVRNSVERARRSAIDEALVLQRHDVLLVQHPGLHKKLLRSLASKYYAAGDSEGYVQTARRMREHGFQSFTIWRRALKMRLLGA